MAGALSGIISDMRAREAMKQREGAANQAQMAAMLRALMTQQAIATRQTATQANSPAAAREKRLQAAQNLRQQRDEADLNYMLQVNPKDLPAPWRPFLAALKANPDVGAAKQLMKAYKPGGIKYIFKDTTDADGNAVSALVAVDTDTGAVSPTSGSAFGGASSVTPAGSGGGVARPSAAVAPTSPRSDRKSVV